MARNGRARFSGGGGGGSAAPSGSAGGDLTGTYPNPTVKASVGLTGTPTAPTAAQGTSTTQIASTAMVQSEVTLLAPKASPTFTGTPSLPTGTTGTTQSAGDNSTKMATTAFVFAGLAGKAASGQTVQRPIPLTVPDASGNAYPLLVAGSNVRLLAPAFLNDVDGDWWGVFRVPQDYSSTPAIILRVASSNTGGLVTTMKVSTIVRDTAAGWDASALTAETQVDTTLSATAYRPSDVSFSLATTPAAGKDLIVKVTHVGTAVNDTLSAPTLLLQAVFQYVTV